MKTPTIWRLATTFLAVASLASIRATSIGTIDLDALLASATYMSLPQNFVSSVAMGVDGKGSIVGYATTDTGQTFAILWTAI